MADGRLIVVGGGAAGIWAALAARTAGASVAVIRQAPGATAVSSGCVDLAARTDLGGRSLPPVDAAVLVARTQPRHPYAALHSSLPGLVGRAATFLKQTHKSLGFRGAEDRNLLLATPLGTVKETWLAQGSIARGDLRAWPQGVTIGVVELPNRAAFDARAVAAGLTSLGYKAVPLPVAFSVHPFATTAELAHRLDEPAAHRAFVEAVAAAALEHGVRYLLLPASSSLDEDGLLDDLLRAGLDGAAEIMGVPPSVPGLRLDRDLEAQLVALEIPLLSGSVRDAVVSGGRVKLLRLEDGGELTADAFILATGRFIGGGIRHEGTFLETVFDLPVFVEGREVGDKWVGDLLNRNAAATQAALTAGIAVDGLMRPVNDLGRPVLKNVFAAGSVIGGYDPGKDGSGLGVAALTALAAADAAVAYTHEAETSVDDSFPAPPRHHSEVRRS